MRPLAAALLTTLLSASSLPALAAEYQVTGAQATFSLNESHLQNLGFSVVDARRPVPEIAVHGSGLEAPLYSFSTDGAIDLRIEVSDGRIRSAHGRPVAFAGGLLIRTENPRTRAALPPLSLYDFRVEIAPDLGRNPVRISGADPAVPFPLEVRNAGFAWLGDARQAALRMGDLVVSSAWAEHLGRPELAGQWLGAFDLRLSVSPSGPDELPLEEAGATLDPQRTIGTTLDVLLGELYDVTSQGHIGTYPTGTAGLSAATTSCNNGDTDVPWNEPMAETHPFIGLALFRVQGDELEMIGNNWIKHGWYALANDQCSLGCVGGGGQYLAIGCSDTYSAANNGSRYVLGPRSEVNPHTGAWSACGSFFDATPVDCLRDYFGGNVNSVERRLEVNDVDLANPGATYFYEGAYFVADDDDLSNNIGWRECTMTWTGSNWDFDDVNPLVFTPNPGPVVDTWGDVRSSGPVATDDGLVFLSVKTTDLGGGQWHYDYALYNRTSARGVHAFSVPVGAANLSNVSFRDLDDKPETDWTWQNSNGVLTWSTDDYATDPDAPALTWQTMYNFRFDADAPPVAAQGRGLLFLPGLGTEFFLDSQAPAPGATSVASTFPASSGLSLQAVEPNPFSGSTRISFTRETRGSTRLSVVDVSGRTVRVLLDGEAPQGRSSSQWDGRDDAGARVANGVYFFRLEAANDVRTVKATLLR